MRGIYDYSVLSSDGKEIYFAGANTAAGFVGCYDEIADERSAERVYVIKGGSGTGKSTLMRHIGEEAEKGGFPVTYYLCGSDPHSIDCVVLDGRIAVLDGTAPHIRDMTYPGATSELIDVSRFWNSGMLEMGRNTIVEATQNKKHHYASVYRYLAAAELLQGEIASYTERVFLGEKASAAIGRLFRKWGSPEGKMGEVHTVRTAEIGLGGCVYSDVLRNRGKTIYRVRDALGCAVPFLEMLIRRGREAGYRMTVSRLPAPDIPVEVLIEDCGVLVTAFTEEDQAGESTINMARFVSGTIPMGLRGAIRLAARIQESCLAEAVHHLKLAGECHFAIEEIYVRAMDFHALRAYQKEITKAILTRLRG